MSVDYLTAAEYLWDQRRLKGIWAVRREKSGILKKDSREMTGKFKGEWERSIYSFALLNPNSYFLLITGSVMNVLMRAAIAFLKSSVDPAIFVL